MSDYTITTPQKVYRVIGTSYIQVEQAAKDAGLKVLGIHRDGDDTFYQPGFTPKPLKRKTAVSAAFEAAGVGA